MTVVTWAVITAPNVTILVQVGEIGNFGLKRSTCGSSPAHGSRGRRTYVIAPAAAPDPAPMAALCRQPTNNGGPQYWPRLE